MRLSAQISTEPEQTSHGEVRMKSAAWVTLGTAAAGLLGVFAIGPIQRSVVNDDGDDGGTAPARWLSDAAIHIGANPARVVFGDTTRVSWSVSLPAGCSDVRVSLNG